MSRETIGLRSGERLAGKVALIVGGGSTGEYPGTGSAMARLFAAQGAAVSIMGRTADHTQRTVDSVTAEGGRAISVIGDTTVKDDCAAAVDATVKAFGGLDIVVNNVAVHKGVSIDAFDESTWNEIFDGNLKALMMMASQATPHLRNAGSGSIINIGSVAGVQSSGQIGYGTAKAAVIPLTRDMAVALGNDGIRVNCVVPGHLHTPHVDRLGSNEEMRQLRNKLNVLGIEGDGWDAAWAALYFASDESRFVTGQSLVVDGGVTSLLAMAQVMRTRSS